MSAILLDQREFDEALALQRRALDIWTAAHGENHARVAIGHNNVGSTLRKLGHHEQAVVHYERSLAISEVTMGAKHPTVGMMLDNLGDMMRLSERYAGATAHLQQHL